MDTYKEEGFKANTVLNQTPPVGKSSPEKLSEATPIVSTSSPRKKINPKKFFTMTALAIILLTALFVLFKNQKTHYTEKTTTETAEHVFEEYPDFPGIPITDKTVSFVKADGKFCLLYKGVVYTPQDSGVLTPKTKTATDEMYAFPWIGLVNAPENLVESKDEVFSFKESPSNNSFVFIMRWGNASREEFWMYRFFNNKFSELKKFNSADGLYYMPKLNFFSPGGNFLNISLFTCADCLSEKPETMLYYIPTGNYRNIGKVSFFEWGEDDNIYRYKEYKEGVDSKDTPLRTNEFFKKSDDLLTPPL